jgi:hypothetical protein
MIAAVILSGTALAEPVTDPSKNAFATKITSGCTARYKLGYDSKGKRYDPRSQKKKSQTIVDAWARHTRTF